MANCNAEVVIKYECSNCSEQHDYESCAEECCRPDVIDVYICPICETDYETRKEAEHCIEVHAAIGLVIDTCPACLRWLKEDQHKVEATITGHCSTCNPIYTPEQNLAIKYTLEPKE